MSEGEPTEEELRAALEEQMRRIRVEDVIVQTTVTLINLAARRLGLTGAEEDAAAERDIGQARLAIDGARALLPLVPEEQAAQLRDPLSQLQMAYAREAGAGEGTPAAAPEGEPPAGDDPDRAKARSKIWTPPGSS